MTAVTRERAELPESVNRFQEEITGYVRSPSDVLRTVVFTVAILLLVVLAKWSRDAVQSLEDELIQRLSFVPPEVERILAGALSLAVLVAVTAAWAVPLLIRRYRLFGYLLVGVVLVSLLLRGVEWFLDRGAPESLMREVAQRTGVDSPLTVYGLAQTATSFVVLAPFVSRRWRGAGAVLLAARHAAAAAGAHHAPGHRCRRARPRGGGGLRNAADVRPPQWPADTNRHRCRADQQRPPGGRTEAGRGRRPRLRSLLRHPGGRQPGVRQGPRHRSAAADLCSAPTDSSG